MVFGRPSSSREKSSLVRLRTIFPCLSRTVAKTFTTLTPVVKVVLSCPLRRRATATDAAENSRWRREKFMVFFKMQGAGQGLQPHNIILLQTVYYLFV